MDKKTLLILLCIIPYVNLLSQEQNFCISEFKRKFPKYFEQKKDINYILEPDSCTEFMFYNGEGLEKLQAIGYIENYKGLDLFFANTEYLEDTNDQESDGFSVEYMQMYIFRDGILLKNIEDNLFDQFKNFGFVGFGSNIGFTHCQDQTSCTSLNYIINTDTTFTFTLINTDYSLITGFKSSFDIRFDVESTLDSNGRFVVDTVKLRQSFLIGKNRKELSTKQGHHMINKHKNLRICRIGQMRDLSGGKDYKIEKNNNKKSRLAANIALSNEMLNDIEFAISWIDTAISLTTSRETSDYYQTLIWYKDKLKQREANLPILKKQFTGE